MLLTLFNSTEVSRFINCSSAASINPCMAVTTVRILCVIVCVFFFWNIYKSNVNFVGGKREIRKKNLSHQNKWNIKREVIGKIDPKKKKITKCGNESDRLVLKKKPINIFLGGALIRNWKGEIKRWNWNTKWNKMNRTEQNVWVSSPFTVVFGWIKNKVKRTDKSHSLNNPLHVSRTPAALGFYFSKRIK